MYKYDGIKRNEFVCAADIKYDLKSRYGIWVMRVYWIATTDSVRIW